MAFETSSLRDYYMLHRESFSLDPFRDKGVFFGDSSISKRITDRIEDDFLDPRGIPKFFVHGFFGSGKTHTLLHIAHLLETKFAAMYPTEPIYLDIAPLTAREHWIKIHGRLLDAIGLDRIEDAVEKAADRIEGRDKAEGFMANGATLFGDDSLKRSQASVFRNLLFGGKQNRLSWEWMKGKKLTVDEDETLGTRKQLTEVQDYVNCLLNLGAVYHLGTGKRIVLLIDEAEAFTTVTNADSVAEIRHAFRMLLENSNSVVGLILGTQVEGGLEEMGDLFTRDDIRRRVGYEQGYIDLNGLLLGVNDAGEFIKNTLAYVVDQRKAAKVVEEEGLDTDGSLFPFTEESIRTIEEHVRDNPDRALPSAILSYMSNSAIEAWRRRSESEVHQLVDSTIVEESIFPGESVG